MRQSGAHTFPQNLPFELSKDGQQAGHGSTSGCRQVQRLGQRHETNVEMIEFLQGGQQVCHGSAPTVQAPYQHHVDFPTARSLQQFLASLPLRGPGAHLANLHHDRPAAPRSILAHGTILHGQSLLIVRRHAGIQSRAKHF
jgi:hypothetical protein